MTFPKITIVTPCYNAEKFIADAIESVAEQNYPNLEHIVLDAASSDGTVEVLERYRHLPHLRWRSEPDEGQTDAINKGFKMATGDILAWLNADDYYLPGTFDKVVAQFAKHPDTDLLYGAAVFADAEKRVQRVKHEHPFDYGVLLYYGCYIQSTATFMHRRIFDAGHYLDKSYKVCMDYEFFVRLAKAGFRFRYLPEALAGFRWHGDNISTKYKSVRLREHFQIKTTYGRRVFRDDARQARLHKILFRFYRLKRVVLVALRGLGGRRLAPSLSGSK